MSLRNTPRFSPSFPSERLCQDAAGHYQLGDGSSDTFGYAEAGAKLTIDLTDELGKAAPTLDVGARYLMLGGVLDDLNAGDSDEVIFSVGPSWSF